MPRVRAIPADLVSGAAGGGHDESHEIVDAVVAASRALVGVAARSLVGLEEDVTLAQYRMLVVLSSRGAQRVADLAQLLGVQPSTATRMIERLVAKGLARRHRGRQDRRSVRVAVTSTGRVLVDEVTHRRREEISRIVRGMAPEDRQPLVDALRAFSEAAGEVPEQSWTIGWG